MIRRSKAQKEIELLQLQNKNWSEAYHLTQKRLDEMRIEIRRQQEKNRKLKAEIEKVKDMQPGFSSANFRNEIKLYQEVLNNIRTILRIY